MLYAIGEDDIELDNQVTSRSISFHLELCRSIHNDIARERLWHALTCHSKLCLWRDDIRRGHEDFPIIESVHGDRLHLERLYKRQSVRVDQVATFALVIWQWLLSELDHEVRRVRAKRLMAAPLIHKLR